MRIRCRCWTTDDQWGNPPVPKRSWPGAPGLPSSLQNSSGIRHLKKTNKRFSHFVQILKNKKDNVLLEVPPFLRGAPFDAAISEEVVIAWKIFPFCSWPSSAPPLSSLHPIMKCACTSTQCEQKQEIRQKKRLGGWNWNTLELWQWEWVHPCFSQELTTTLPLPTQAVLTVVQ